MASELMWDVIVAGAGPAGSTVAHLLARAGLRVLICEREQFPRFHIGESLLPPDLAIFERLGISLDDFGYLRKRGARFLHEATGLVSASFPFDQGLPGTPPHAYQVDRAPFDAALLEAARGAGVELRMPARVGSVEFEVDGAKVEVAGERLHCRYFVDASGQGTLMGRKLRSIEPIEHLGRTALFRRYHGLPQAAIDELFDHGEIQILVREVGWAWVIPLFGTSAHGRRQAELSIGVVCGKGPRKLDFYDQFVEESPSVQRWIAGAATGPVMRAANFSYRNTQSYGSRYACVGDAACFLDPVFSSGVTMAMVAAERLADVLIAAFADGREAESNLAGEYAAYMQQGYDCFEQFIYRFYHSNLAKNLFFSTPPKSDIGRGVISVLAGDVWRSDNPFQKILMTSKRTAKPVEANDPKDA